MNNLDKIQIITPQKKLTNVPVNKADVLSKQTSSTNLLVPTSTSSKPRSASKSSKKDESFSLRAPMEEELNPFSEPVHQSLRAQEQEMEQKGSKSSDHTNMMNLPIYMQIKKADDPKNNGNQHFEEEKEEEAKFNNNGPTFNSSLRPRQDFAVPTNPTTNTALLAQLEKATGADIEKKFFTLKNCLLCGTHISRKFIYHIKDHINGKKNIEIDYSFCLDADGKTLQVKCNNCPQAFTKLTANKLQEHNQVCNSGKRIPSNGPLGSIVDNGSERLEKCEEEIKVLKEQYNSLKTSVTVVTEDLKDVKETVGNHGDILMGMFKKWEKDQKSKEPSTPVRISDRVKRKDKTENASKEKERERDRSREQANNGSPKRMTERDRRYQARERERERTEERRSGSRENSSEERYQDSRRKPRYYNNYKGSNRKY